MQLNDLDFVKLLPAFMRQDEADKGLSNGINIVARQMDERIQQASTWNQIDNMSAEELDWLADEIHIGWYDRSASITAKRQIIKDSDLVQMKLGTNWAAVRVIETYFGAGEIEDWYKYGGEPYHFKIKTINQSVLEEQYQKFISILNRVKRESAVLDSIEMIADGVCKINEYKASVESSIMTTLVRR